MFPQCKKCHKVVTPLVVIFFNHKNHIALKTYGHQIDAGGTPVIQRHRVSARKKKKDFVCSYICKARLRMSLGIRHSPSGEIFPEPVGSEESERDNCLSWGIKHSDGPGGRESSENVVPHWLPSYLAGVCVSMSPCRTLISLETK